MTPNGAIVFVAVLVIAAVFADARGLALLYAVLAVFAIVAVGTRSMIALRRALLVMAPLAAFMLIVWVGVVGRAPSEIAAGVPGTRGAAMVYVATVAARLFLIVSLIQIVAARFENETPLDFVRALRAPLALKRLAILTMSLIETLRHAIDRAHTALIAGGVVTRGLSLRNVGHGWVLVQTVWLTAITTVTARVRDKWPVEHTLALLDPVLSGSLRAMSRADVSWTLLALGAAAASQIASLNAA